MQNNQNIYDNQAFFDAYKSLRERKDNYNVLLEQPAMTALLPELNGKRVLDLGCGYGQNAHDFIQRGAEEVFSVDISEKMLDIAKKENADEKIRYYNMSMTDIDTLGGDFDFVYSSLAVHYIEDFSDLLNKIFASLKPGGCLLFSQEHPICTATFGGRQFYTKDESGKHESFTFSNYGEPGERNVYWFVDGVRKYHRRISDIINSLIESGFVIKKICEPLPGEEAIRIRPSLLDKERIKPTFLIILAEKR